MCAGEIDCGFIIAPYSPELDVTVLMRDRMLAVLPPDHPLADAPCYPLQRFSEERIIKLTDEANNEVSKVFDQLNAHLDTPVTAYCDVNDDYSIMAMVESGLGVSLLSELVTCRMPFDIRLKELDPPQYRDVAIAVKKGRRPSPAMENSFRSLWNISICNKSGSEKSPYRFRYGDFSIAQQLSNSMGIIS